MSLLLEALKKAELAKQAAKEPPPAAEKPPLTRDGLPDISAPMQIHGEELRLVESEPGRTHGPAHEPGVEDAARTASAESGFSLPAENAERKQAQQLFEANALDVNPRKPFYITVGALGLFALGTVGYFWYELQPRTIFTAPPVAAQPAPPPIAAATAAEPAAPAATKVTPPVSAEHELPPPIAIATETTAAAAAAPVAPAAAQSGARRKARARRTAPANAPAAVQPRTAAAAGAIIITPARVQADPVLESAYQAFNAGDLTRSRDDYRQVLRTNPGSRDALLGLAAVEMQAKHYDAAERYYARLLELDPRDAYAHAGLIGLKGQTDPLSAESRLKNMIAAQPEASFLNFSLGNQYAAQRRWAEAQQAYFRAYSGDPEHPDFAYNLAVSLDKMHQTKPALEYYRRALTLAESRPVTFDRAQVSKRVSQLAR